MDVMLVVGDALDRWALVGSLGLDAGAGADLPTGFARIAHPASTSADVVLLVRGDVELDWIRRVRGATSGDRRPVVVAVCLEGVSRVRAALAGADAVVPWDGTSPLGPSVDAARADARVTTLVLPPVRTTTA